MTFRDGNRNGDQQDDPHRGSNGTSNGPHGDRTGTIGKQPCRGNPVVVDIKPDPIPSTPPMRPILQPPEWDWLSHQLTLSPREMEVVQHIFNGHSEARAAYLMNLSQDTVHTYIKRTYAKLDVHDQKELILHIIKVYLDHFVRNGEGDFTAEGAEQGGDSGSDLSRPKGID